VVLLWVEAEEINTLIEVVQAEAGVAAHLHGQTKGRDQGISILAGILGVGAGERKNATDSQGLRSGALPSLDNTCQYKQLVYFVWLEIQICKLIVFSSFRMSVPYILKG
jgi:hypothetical protein